MGEGPKSGNEGGCSSSSATCEHSPGTVRWHSGRARNQAEKLSAPRIKPSEIKSAGLRSCLDFFHFRDLHSKSMNSVLERSNQSVDENPCLVTDALPSRVAPVDLPPAFIGTTTTTCREGQHTSHQTSPSMLSVRLRKLASCTLPRHSSVCEMCSKVDVRRSMTSQVFKSALFLMFLIASLSRPISATMEITAYEYQRKFHKPLDLGECSQREVTVDLGNNTFHTEEQRCTLQQRGVVTHMPRELNDSRNVLITSANAIVNYLGLCGGEAASFLGILNSGDCVAIEIASQLTFSNKTMIRAFVGYYRKSLDILEGGDGPLDGMETYYKDKFYLKNRSYGTLEIIFVQFRFDNVRATEEAKKIVLDTPVMSAYMEQVQRKIGTPKNIVVISLSTATQKKYPPKKYNKENWERGLRYVEILELTIQKTRHQINSNAIVPHLQYQLQPFVISRDFGRLTKPELWEKTSMLEVQLRQAINLAKKTTKKCRGNTSRPCDRARELRSTLTTIQSEIHKGRSNWVNLTAEEKNQFATRYTAKVNSYINVTKNLAKIVRDMKSKEKLEKLERKKNTLNQIPVHTEGQPPRSQHRIRHARSRNRLRNGQGR